MYTYLRTVQGLVRQVWETKYMIRSEDNGWTDFGRGAHATIMNQSDVELGPV